MVGKGPQTVGGLCMRWYNKYLEIKTGNEVGVAETWPHIKMLLGGLCSGQTLILHHIATDSANQGTHLNI